MKFCVLDQQTAHNAHSPIRVVEQTTGRTVGWINRYLDREYVRRLANTTLRTYAHHLLHFVRWWESLHYTGDVVEADLTESTLLDFVKFQPLGKLKTNGWCRWIPLWWRCSNAYDSFAPSIRCLRMAGSWPVRTPRKPSFVNS